MILLILVVWPKLRSILHNCNCVYYFIIAHIIAKRFYEKITLREIKLIVQYLFHIYSNDLLDERLAELLDWTHRRQPRRRMEALPYCG